MALELVGDVALGTLEGRLASLILGQAAGTHEVHLTHERLARDLACAREAVSRILGPGNGQGSSGSGAETWKSSPGGGWRR